ncbi:MAG: hypothetical protein ACOC10_01560 [Bacteroidota bacterium]
MKPKVRTFTALLIMCLLIAGTTARAEEQTKEYNESWPVNSVQTLEISNRFGEVKVADKGGNDVTINVVVTVEAASERRARELLDLINVSFNKTGNTVTAETHISRSFSSRQRFSIDYEVNIPPDKNLDITNKYGNTFVNVLNADGIFDIQYGNISINELNTPDNGTAELNLAYGKSDIQSANDMNVTVQYSNMNFGTMNDLKLNSKYTKTFIDKVGSVNAESKYDTFDFEMVGSLKANTKYTHIRMEKLAESLNLDAGYGGIQVESVDNAFKDISVTSSYGQVALGLDGASYSLDASCNYCGISFPEDNFSGNRMTENHTRTIKGKVGNGAGGNVYIKSRYGEIKLN